MWLAIAQKFCRLVPIMLKKRIIPVLLLCDGRMVKGINFGGFRDTGSPKTAVRIYSAQDSDELIFLDVQASLQSRQSMVNTLRDASTECFIPLAVGGGIRTIEDVREFLRFGADKVVVTTASVTQPTLISQIAERFGSQSVIAGIDYKYEDGSPKVWVRCGTVKTDLDPVEHAVRLSSLGAGEIFLNSIDRDGVMGGYDLELVQKVAQAVTIPVIACGGAGNFMHIADLLKETQVSAAACASIFHFGDNNPIRARSYLRNLDVAMRVVK